MLRPDLMLSFSHQLLEFLADLRDSVLLLKIEVIVIRLVHARLFKGVTGARAVVLDSHVNILASRLH